MTQHERIDMRRSTARQLWRYWPVGAALVVGVAISLAFFQFSWTSRLKAVDAEFRGHAEQSVRVFSGAFAEYENLVRAVSIYIQGTGGKQSDQDFANVASKLMESHAGIQEIDFAPRISRPLRDSFEGAMRRRGYSGFEIHDRKFDGTQIAAAGRDEYFPLMYVVPRQGNEMSFGLDLGAAQPEILAHARDSGDLASSKPIDFTQREAPIEARLLVVAPIFLTSNRTSSVERRRADLIGFAVAVLKPGEMFNAIVRSALMPKGLDQYLFFGPHPDPSHLVFTSRSRLDDAKENPPLLQPAFLASGQLSRVTFADRSWTLLTVSAASNHSRTAGAGEWRVLTIGLLVTALTCGYLIGLIRRAALLQISAAALAKEADERHLAEQRATYERDLSRHYFEAAGAIMLVLNPDGTIALINQKGQEVLGYSQSEMIGQAWVDRFVPDRMKATIRDMLTRNFLGTSDALKFTEYPVITKNGEERLIAWRRAAILGPDGACIGIISSGEDVTGRRQAERDLQFTNTLLATTLESSPEGILVVDESAHVVSFNRRFVDMWHVPAELIEARADAQILRIVASQVRDTDGFLARVQFLYAHPDEPARDALVTLDGRTIDRHTQAMRTKAGQYLGRVWFFHDVTDRVLAEQAMRDSEEKFRSLVESSSDWIWEVDAAGRYTYASPKVRDLLGYEPGEVIGKLPTDFMVPSEAERVGLFFKENVDRRQAFAMFENMGRHKNGREVALETSGVPVFDAHGELKGYRGVDRDITDRKQAIATIKATLERTLRQLDAIGEISKAEALSSGDIGAMAHHITELAAAAIGCERVNVWLFNDDETELRCVDLYESSSATHSSGIVLRESEYRNEFRALKSGTYVAADSPLTDTRTIGYAETYLKPLRITAMLDALIEIGDRHLGLLCFEHVNQPHHWEQDEIAFAHQVADKIGISILNQMRRIEEEKVRISEAALAQAQAVAHIGSWSYNPRTNILTQSQECFRILGVDPATFQSTYEAYLGRIHPDDREAFERAFRDSVSSRKAYMCDYRIKMEDGRIKWVHDIAENLFDADGRHVGIAGTMQDITDRKLAEIALTQEHEFTTALIASLPGLFVLIDEGGRLVRWNENLPALTGIPADKLRGQDAITIITELDRSLAQEKFGQAFLRGDTDVEFRMLTKGGGFRTIHFSGRKIVSEGHPYLLAIGVDRTEAREAEHRLEESEERLRTIFASISEGILVQDAKTGVFLDANPRICEMYGYSREEFLKLDWNALSAGIHPYALADSAALLDRARSGEAVVFEWLSKTKSDHHFWLEISLRRATYGGHDVLLSTSRDITERHKATEALTYRDEILHAVTVGTAALIASESLEGGISEALEVVGETLKVSRVLVFQQSPDEARPPECRYSWQEASLTGQINEVTHLGAASDEFDNVVPTWLAPLKLDMPVVGSLSQSEGAVRRYLERLQTRSVLILRIVTSGRIWGMIGIDDCVSERTWTVTEIDAMKTLAEVIGIVLSRHSATLQLQRSEERFRTVSETAQEAIVMTDALGMVIYWNRAAEQTFGYTAKEAVGKDVHEWLTPQRFRDRARAGIATFAATGQGNVIGKTLEFAAIRKDGTEIPIEISISGITLGADRHAVALVRDISERKRSEAEIVRMARYDALTGLANRNVFVDELRKAIAEANRGRKGFSVLYLDLDHFKDINDTLGHPIGDELLKLVADRLRSTVRETDTVARFGGDEFAIIVTDIAEPAEAAMVADKLLNAVRQPFFIQGNEIRSGTSVGIAVFGPESADAEALLSHADVALYRAKSEGRGTYRFFTDAMDTEVRTRVVLSEELRVGIAEGQLFLAYEPQVDADTGRLIGLEALVRWRSPTRGVVLPGEFIPVAEKGGLIIALGRWVLREACRQAKAWLDEGIAPPLIGVNLSGLQFKAPLELERDIAAILAETRLPPQLLELELTETVLMEASREHNDVLLRLRESGLRLAIDDFGTGYSSLDYLRRFPVDRIKVAQSFVLESAEGTGSAAIVKAAIGLARELKLDVVVEGVETAEQLARVRAWGCHKIQGFYFSKPLLAAEIVPLLRAGKVAPAMPRAVTATK